MGVSGNTTTLVVAVVALVGTVATAILTPVLSGRVTRLRADADARQARRAEVKSAIAAYLEVAQRVHAQFYASEHGRPFDDVPLMIEQIWTAHDQVVILCATELRSPLDQHASALNDVARHPDRYPDWWTYIGPYNAALLNAVRIELARPELAASGRSLQGSTV
jgi:hypothetical protein